MWKMMRAYRDMEDNNRNSMRGMRSDDMEEELERAYKKGRKDGWREAMKEVENKRSFRDDDDEDDDDFEEMENYRRGRKRMRY